MQFHQVIVFKLVSLTICHRRMGSHEPKKTVYEKNRYYDLEWSFEAYDHRDQEVYATIKIDGIGMDVDYTLSEIKLKIHEIQSQMDKADFDFGDFAPVAEIVPITFLTSSRDAFLCRMEEENDAAEILARKMENK